MSSKVEASPSSSRPNAGTASTLLPQRQISVIETKEDAESYPPCNYCKDSFEVDDVMIFDTRQKLSSHAGCYLITKGSDSTFQIPDMSNLSTPQRSSVFKKARARLDALEGRIPSIAQAPAALPAEKSHECKSCTRMSSNTFFHGSSKAESLLTQLHHFDILLQDEFVLPSFKRISEELHRRTLHKIISAVLFAASGASYGTNWTHRSIAVCTALAATRLEALLAALLPTTSTDQVLADVDNYLRTLDTRIFLRNLITGVAYEDVRVMSRYPLPSSLPESQFIISPRFIHERHQELAAFSKKVDPEGAITATLWAIVGVVAATGTQPLGTAKVPRKARPKKEVNQEAENADGSKQAVVDAEGTSGNAKKRAPVRQRASAKQSNEEPACDKEGEVDEEELQRGPSKKKAPAKKSRVSTSSNTITKTSAASKRGSAQSSSSNPRNAKKLKLDDEDDFVGDDNDMEEDQQASKDGNNNGKVTQPSRRTQRGAALKAKHRISGGAPDTAPGLERSDDEGSFVFGQTQQAGLSFTVGPPSPLRPSSQTGLLHNSPKAPSKSKQASSKSKRGAEGDLK